MEALKVRKIGNSLGVLLPREMVARLRVEEGDALYLTDAPDGYRLTALDQDFADKWKPPRR